MSTSKNEFVLRVLEESEKRKAERQAKSDAIEAMQNELDRQTYYGYRTEKNCGRGAKSTARAFQC